MGAALIAVSVVPLAKVRFGKNRFVSGHRFSDAVSAEKLLASAAA
jgi:hypothetical protein